MFLLHFTVYLFTRSISPIKLNETYGWCLFCWWFQILPQLLYYFSVNNEIDSLDWATIVAYTCEASCEGGVAYKEEYAWVQLSSPSATVPW